MAKYSDYKGTATIHAGLIPQNNNDFPLLDAHYIVTEDGTRLDERLAAGFGGGATAEPPYALKQQLAANNTDIDDYKTAGLYYFSGQYTYSNLPDQTNSITSDDSSNGWLEVFTRGESTEGNDYYVKQIFHRHGTVGKDNCHHTFVRNYCWDNTTNKNFMWSPWKRFATVDEVGSSASPIAPVPISLGQIFGESVFLANTDYRVTASSSPIKEAVYIAVGSYNSLNIRNEIKNAVCAVHFNNLSEWETYLQFGVGAATYEAKNDGAQLIYNGSELILLTSSSFSRCDDIKLYPIFNLS